MRAEQDIENAGGLLAVLRNGHRDATVLIDAHRNAADEIERLRAIEDTAIDLVENIRERGLHDNWKRLADALAVKLT